MSPIASPPYSSQPGSRTFTGGLATAALNVELTPEFIECLAGHVAAVLQSAPAAPEPWVGVKEAAEFLGCRDRRVYDLVEQQRIPCRHEGRFVKFRLSELNSWLERDAPAQTVERS